MRRARASAGAVGVDPQILDQLRRVRWRRTAREVQRIVHPVVAAAGTGAALAVLAALRGGTLAFIAVAGAAAVGLLVTLVVAIRSGWRRRLSRERAVVWIDDTAGLRGALATLVGVRTPSPLRDLLAVRNRFLLRNWTPERVVPAVIPVASCCAAVAGLAVLALVVAIAPRLLPAPPEIVVADTPLVAADTRGLATRGDRLVVGRDGGIRGGDGVHDGHATRAIGGGDGANATSWPTIAQERIRRSLWGEAWDRVRDELARAEETRRRAAGRTGRQPDARLATRGGRPGSEPAIAAEQGLANDAGAEPPATDEDGGNGIATAGPGSGAGDATDDRLFGSPQDEVHTAADPFALALAARVHTRGAGPRPPSGEAPEASPDERPDLAARQRREDAAHRMSVGPAYERIVRSLYAHDATPKGDTP